MTAESRLISALAFGPGNLNGSMSFSFCEIYSFGKSNVCLSEGAEQPSIIAQLSSCDLQAIQIRFIHDVMFHGFFDRIKDQPTTPRYTTTEDDNGWIEDVQEFCHCLTDKATSADEGFFSHFVALFGGLCHLASADLRCGAEDRMTGRMQPAL